METKEQIRIDEVYRGTPLEQIPWNNEKPPELLVELIEKGKVQPCRAIDLGCGAGNYAVYLAGRGFDVTGVDFSPTAIKIAKENAKKKSVECNFIVGDVVEELSKLSQTWDFAYDWGLLHHILPERRQKYVDNVCRILNPGGKYLSLCFSRQETGFGGSGKLRESSLGTVLYFSSEDELKELFSRCFGIIDLRTMEISGKFTSHIFNYVFMEKK